MASKARQLVESELGLVVAYEQASLAPRSVPQVVFSVVPCAWFIALESSSTDMVALPPASYISALDIELTMVLIDVMPLDDNGCEDAIDARLRLLRLHCPQCPIYHLEQQTTVQRQRLDIGDHDDSGRNIQLMAASSLTDVRACIVSKRSIYCFHQFETQTQSLIRLDGLLLFNMRTLQERPTAPRTFVAFQLLRLLADLHDCGLVHGNLSLQNVLLDDSFWIQVLAARGTSTLDLASDSIDDYDYEDDGDDDDGKDNERENSTPIDIFAEAGTQDWQNGTLSNYDYLMRLNHLAGRRRGCPSAHPIMPWVTTFDSDSLPQANDAAWLGWRDLSKTKYRLRMGDAQLDSTFASDTPHHIPDILPDTTYYVYMARSTPVAVLRQFVRDRFEPGEYPSSMRRMYDWSPDECIPEFYDNPAILKSIHDSLPDIQLPAWANGSTREFVKKHRELLESDRVSQHLHEWIDLNFGYKLDGEAAVEAKNVVLSLAIDSSSPAKLTDHAVRVLFTTSHPQRFGGPTERADDHKPGTLGDVGEADSGRASSVRSFSIRSLHLGSGEDGADDFLTDDENEDVSDIGDRRYASAPSLLLADSATTQTSGKRSTSQSRLALRVNSSGTHFDWSYFSADRIDSDTASLTTVTTAAEQQLLRAKYYDMRCFGRILEYLFCSDPTLIVLDTTERDWRDRLQSITEPAIRDICLALRTSPIPPSARALLGEDARRPYSVTPLMYRPWMVTVYQYLSGFHQLPWSSRERHCLDWLDTLCNLTDDEAFELLLPNFAAHLRHPETAAIAPQLVSALATRIGQTRAVQLAVHPLVHHLEDCEASDLFDALTSESAMHGWVESLGIQAMLDRILRPLLNRIKSVCSPSDLDLSVLSTAGGIEPSWSTAVANVLIAFGPLLAIRRVLPTLVDFVASYPAALPHASCAARLFIGRFGSGAIEAVVGSLQGWLAEACATDSPLSTAQSATRVALLLSLLQITIEALPDDRSCTPHVIEPVVALLQVVLNYCRDAIQSGSATAVSVLHIQCASVITLTSGNIVQVFGNRLTPEKQLQHLLPVVDQVAAILTDAITSSAAYFTVNSALQPFLDDLVALSQELVSNLQSSWSSEFLLAHSSSVRDLVATIKSAKKHILIHLQMQASDTGSGSMESSIANLIAEAAEDTLPPSSLPELNSGDNTSHVSSSTLASPPPASKSLTSIFGSHLSALAEYAFSSNPTPSVADDSANQIEPVDEVMRLWTDFMAASYSDTSLDSRVGCTLSTLGGLRSPVSILDISETTHSILGACSPGSNASGSSNSASGAHISIWSMYDIVGNWDSSASAPFSDMSINPRVSCIASGAKSLSAAGFVGLDARQLYFCSPRPTVVDIATGSTVCAFSDLPSGSNFVTATAFRECVSGRLLCGGLNDGTIVIMDAVSDKIVHHWMTLPSTTNTPAPAPATAHITSLTTSLDGRTIVVGYDNGSISTLDMRAGKLRDGASGSGGGAIENIQFLAPDLMAIRSSGRRRLQFLTTSNLSAVGPTIESRRPIVAVDSVHSDLAVIGTSDGTLQYIPLIEDTDRNLTLPDASSAYTVYPQQPQSATTSLKALRYNGLLATGHSSGKVTLKIAH